MKMLQIRITTLILMILVVAPGLPAFAFILERPNNVLGAYIPAALDIPANWNIAPSLKVEQKSLSDLSREEKVQFVDPNKQTQASIPKNASERISNKEHDIKAHGEAGMIKDQKQLNIQKQMKRSVDSDATSPRNIVLVLVAATDKKEGKILRNISPPLDVEGYLQTCHNVSSGFSTKAGLLPENKEDNCNCDDFLRMNVGPLLTWAHHECEMATGTVLGSNFTLPSRLRPHRMPQYTRMFDEFEESRGTVEIPKVRPEIHYDWRAIGFEKQRERIQSSGNASHIKDDDVRRTDNMWGVIDEFSKLRLAFFRKLLETLARNMETWPSTFRSGKWYPLHPNLTEHTANTIRELKSGAGERGYMMMVAVSENEAIDVVEFLRREITKEADTLLVVTEVCSRDSNPLAFFADGPGSKAVREATMIWELPTIIKNTIVSSCQITGRPVRPHTLPNDIIEIEVHREPLIFQMPDNDLADKPYTSKRDARAPDNFVTDGGKSRAYGDSSKVLQGLQARLT